MSDDPFSQHVTLAEAADELGVHVQTARKLVKSGQLKAIKFSSKYLINVDDLAKFKETYNPSVGRKRKLKRFA